MDTIQRIMRIFLFILLSISAFPSYSDELIKQSGDVHRLETKNGLLIEISDKGAIIKVGVDGVSLPVLFPDSGLWYREFGKVAEKIEGKLTSTRQSVIQQFEASDLNINAVYTIHDDYILCNGYVEDYSGSDRAVDIIFSLPIGNQGWNWGKSIREEVPLAGNSVSAKYTTFSSLSNRETGIGISLAVPPHSPCDCDFSHDSSIGYSLKFQFGLSAEGGGKYKSRAPFSFIIYRSNGIWGLRDAAKRYYKFYPEAFIKRVKHEGLWLFGNPPEWLPDVENYTFHEGGYGRAKTDDEYNIYTLPYINPGVREITRLSSLPISRKHALSIFEDQILHPNKYIKPIDINTATIIKNSLLFDQENNPVVKIRNTRWGKNSVSFPLNANPKLSIDIGVQTNAAEILDRVSGWLDKKPELDGIYVDSLFSWGRYENFRREHFKYIQIPLTYNKKTGKPAISNQFSLLEFLWGLGGNIHPRDKIIFGNGTRPERKFHFFALDVMGVEGRNHMEQGRVMAFQKPFLMLIKRIHEDPEEVKRVYHLSTLYGIYPSFGHMRIFNPLAYEPIQKLNDKFVPVLRKITKAGWEPVTNASSDNPSIWIERWGSGEDGEIYLTIYNSTNKIISTDISINTKLLNFRGTTMQFRDEMSGEYYNDSIHDYKSNVKLTIPSKEVRVIYIREIDQTNSPT